MAETSPKKRRTSSPQPVKPAYELNLNRFLVKDAGACSLHDLVFKDVSVLHGLGKLGAEALNHRKVKTVLDLANWKFYKIARAILTLEAAEEVGGRDEEGAMNINKALDKKWETKSLHEILAAPISALQGLTPEDDELFAHVHVKSIRQLGSWRFARWAEAICDAADFEKLDHAHR
eukprot:TRINITY_DN31567_c0_g1_i1.p1 TRINITY_DN31567_c0_g1~~TRINITY_DN31567_c0_g1_i1.p1  ORF type:complete len:176 (-),score=46.13 TRINITY_DN31567_c0_g1_i1:120-647(-)